MLHFFPKQLHSHKTIPALRTTASKTKVDFDMNNIAKKQFLLCALQRRKRKLILICFTHTTFTTRYVLLVCNYLAEGKWFTFIIHLIPSNNFYQSINNILIFNTWSNITIRLAVGLDLPNGYSIWCPYMPPWQFIFQMGDVALKFWHRFSAEWREKFFLIAFLQISSCCYGLSLPGLTM